MVHSFLSLDEYTVHVDFHIMTDLVLEHGFDTGGSPTFDTWLQHKGHHLVAILLKIYYEGSLLLIVLAHPNLIMHRISIHEV